MTTDAATFWNHIADKYSKQPVADPAAFERKIAITRALMEPNDVVLDIGCGTGSLALRLAASAAEVHGLDVSSEMVRIARGKASAAGVSNVTFHVGAFDAGFDVFRDASLHGICAYSLLHLVDDLPGALAQIHRLLKPGGFFVSSTVCLGESWLPYGTLLWVLRKLGKAPRVSVFGKRMLEDEVKRAGFVDLAWPDVGAKPNIGFLTAAKPG